MKRLILIVAVMLTASTPIFAQNSEQENDAAMAAVIYMVAQQRYCFRETAVEPQPPASPILVARAKAPSP